jgi:hypothetical protein
MKKYFLIGAVAAMSFGLASAFAQMTAPGGGPMDDALAKVFGTNLNFSATMKTEMKMMPQNQNISMAGKMYFANGNSRSEIDMTQATGDAIPPQAIAQMKSMGMGDLVSISRKDAKSVYIIYPGLKAYAKTQTADADSNSTNDYKVDVVELGKETLDGHPCVKKQYTVNDAKTRKHLTMISWNATDLKDVPIQIQQTIPGEGDSSNFATIHFSNIDLTKPAASLFDPPVGYTAYTDAQTMIQTELMKKMGGAAGIPGAQ